ncbi:uncharacterized protein [Clytia hemisphaerica]|uniref:uncharacterized protein n=1 Tax=Clytia hemisphaerica TaxID=252671 RepID=UPI0034D4F799
MGHHTDALRIFGNNISSNISKYVDFHLQDHVTKTSSYIKDTTDFINKIETITLPQNPILVTMDVKSLYTNIPNEEGINAINNILTTNKTQNSLKTKILTFLRLILTLNNFCFNETHYLQIKGCAMGTKCAPTYANLFMSQFEESNIYPLLTEKCKTYLRFIDDIFMIWSGTEEELKRFIQEINTLHETIKFTADYSKKEISFLDTIVTISGSKLITRLYKKPTDRSAYLHNQSYHPNHLKKNIPFGQTLRLKRICKDVDDYQKATSEMHGAFLKRGYQQQHLTDAYTKASSIDRSDLLKYKNKSNRDNNQTLFITTFNKNLPNIRE